MNSLIRKNKTIRIFVFVVVNCFLFVSCSEIETKQPQSFYAETAPPPKKEFRWSNGKMPKSFDPALASASPETDVVRAIYEGLTDTNPKTLETVSAIAIDWNSTEDYKTWTFKLRRDAEWSNGEKITAQDFVRSWIRLREMGDKVAHYKMLYNIAGMQLSKSEPSANPSSEVLDIIPRKPLNEDFTPEFQKPSSNSNTSPRNFSDANPLLKRTETSNKNSSTGSKTVPASDKKDTKIEKETKIEIKFGVEAIDDHTLRVSLIKPDKDFPALVANPIFRPIYGDGDEFQGRELNAGIVTSGAFRVFSIGQEGLTLDRAEYYWNKDEIELERVRFVPAENAEKVLEAYRAGEVDAVTNTDFAPLALKLLTPFKDFERTTHSALNFYEFSKTNFPFQDRRVREALAISIERERLTEDDMDGASRPAFGFLPFNENAKPKLSQDTEKAKNLLTEAGFPNGENFPTVKLLINRNNVQQRIARSVAKMWKENLNIETEITVKESADFDAAKNLPEFDLIRRGAVLPTTDETANMLTILSGDETGNAAKSPSEINVNGNEFDSLQSAEVQNSTAENANNSVKSEIKSAGKTGGNSSESPVLTETEALYEFPAIPLYFPTSYSLVKPFILGFETNNLDAPSLKDVKIDNNWQPKMPKSES